MFLKHHSFLRIFVFGRCIYQASVLSFVGKGPVADPDLQISGGEGGSEGAVSKKFFPALRASVWSNNKGWGLPWIRH